MRRWARYTFNAAAVLSLMLAALTVAAWIASYRRACFAWRLTPTHARGVALGRGCVEAYRSELSHAWYTDTSGWRVMASRPTDASAPYAADSPVVFWQWGGFAAWREDGSDDAGTRFTYWYLVVPLWGLTLTLSILPILALPRFVRWCRARRHARGFPVESPVPA